tara:strand:- start:1867 stop:3312 length:1446 start_codon:yes stop_codon:yes gene_type:complete
MTIDNDQIHELAKVAVEHIASENQADFTFPFDLVWQFVPDADEIPSERRSDKWRRLVKEGYIELTGGLTKATSPQRAGSSTREYRLGERFNPTSVGSSVPLHAQNSNIGKLLSRLHSTLDGEGYYISVGELANFYLAMAASPLVILSGTSGTGKSLLPRKFALHTTAGFHSIPIQPQWADNTDLMGYVPSLAPDTHKVGRIFPALKDAYLDPNRLVIALLDEMNLAPVEHYFSDFLSVVETRHRDEEGTTVTDPLPIELPPETVGEDENLAIMRNLSLSSNLRIIGTANMDETTRTFSPKVLDRAFAIEFDEPDLTAFTNGGAATGVDFSDLAKYLLDGSLPISVHEAYTENQELFLHVATLLAELQSLLAPAGIKFGYRSRDAILLYLYHWRTLNLADILSANAAFDFCLLQKILPKVAGIGDALGAVLDGLIEWLGADRSGSTDASIFGFNGPFERSRQKAERMKVLLDSEGATHFWGV